MKATANVPLKVAVAGGKPATLSGNQWTPKKDAAGFVRQTEWGGLPLNTWIEWMGTSLESQLSPPYGAAAGYNDPGATKIAAHYSGFTGCAFDEATGRFYHFGGGHNDSANNMLSCFDAAKGMHSVVISPTHQSMFPPAYNPRPGSLSSPIYPGGGSYNYFPSTETPAGDDKPQANHEYGGMVFVPGINEVLMARYGWFHAQLDSKKWRVGPQTTDANRVSFTNRGGIAFQSNYLPSTGLVYMTSEGGNAGSNAYYSIVKYNPVTRTEVGAISFDSAGYSSSGCVDQKGLLWYFQNDVYGGDTCKVSTVNLATSAAVRGRTDATSRRPSWPIWDELGNPVQYVSDLDKILMWCTTGHAGGANAGEMIEFNRSTLSFSLFPVSGTTAPTVANMSNKMRYWPAKKVMLFQLRTSTNCWLMKLA